MPHDEETLIQYIEGVAVIGMYWVVRWPLFRGYNVIMFFPWMDG